MGGGPVKLDQRTVTKLDFNVLGRRRRRSTGSGAVRGALLGDGLAMVNETNGLGRWRGQRREPRAVLADFPGVANLHNWWLEVLVDGGVVGLALYAVLPHAGAPAGAGARRTRDPLVRYMTLAGALSLIGWIIGSVGPSTAIHFAPMWIVFGLGMGALVLDRHTADREGGAIRVLMLSHMYPSAVNWTAGIFVPRAGAALVALGHDVRVVSPKGCAPPLVPRWKAFHQVPGVGTSDGVPVPLPAQADPARRAPGPPQQRRDAGRHLPPAAARSTAPGPSTCPRAHARAGRLGGRVDRRPPRRAGGGHRPPRRRARRAGQGPRSLQRVREAVEAIDQVCAVSAAIGGAADALGAFRGGRSDRAQRRRHDGLHAPGRGGGPARGSACPTAARSSPTWASWCPRKGVDHLVEAMGILARRPERRPRLVAAGIGEMRPGLERRAAEPGRRRPDPVARQARPRRRGLGDVVRRRLRASLAQRGPADGGVRGDELRPAGGGDGGGRHARGRPRRRDRPAGAPARARAPWPRRWRGSSDDADLAARMGEAALRIGRRGVHLGRPTPADGRDLRGAALGPTAVAVHAPGVGTDDAARDHAGRLGRAGVQVIASTGAEPRARFGAAAQLRHAGLCRRPARPKARTAS